MEPSGRREFVPFYGRRTDRIKALYFSGDGFILLYKRLNNGRFQWPRTAAELRKRDAQAFRWLMEGLEIEPKKAIRKCRQITCFRAKILEKPLKTLYFLSLL
ncbi:MAG: IS66 family insertion sequence element accessory protein TnpB [Oscillospiraceae bacterium]|nr:IS66 family insertion sequence element accessory protein TnpB [Oscillospiraceae bacterium]